MQILGEQLGYKYDQVVLDQDSATVVLISQDGEQELAYRAATLGEAVETACNNLAIIVGCKEEVTG